MCQTKLNGKRQKQIVINYQKMIQNTQINTLNKKSTKYKIHIKKTLNQEKPTKRKNTKNTKQKKNQAKKKKPYRWTDIACASRRKRTACPRRNVNPRDLIFTELFGPLLHCEEMVEEG